MFIPDVKPVYSKQKLHEGLKTLNALWEEGIEPEELRLHRVLTWYSLFNGNALPTAETSDIHRNTIIVFMKNAGTRPIRVRKKWLEIREQYPRNPFSDQFQRLWKAFELKPLFNDSVHTSLIDLWKTGFPETMLVPSYLLWARRGEKSVWWTMERLGLKHRNGYLYHLRPCRNPKSGTAYWLSPLKLTMWDWKKKPGRPRKAVLV